MDNEAEARAHFDRGKSLRDEGAWAAALAEFLLSRQLYPTWSATANAAHCLRKLQRFDEALALFEIILRDYLPTLPADTKAAVQRVVIELRALVGTIEIAGAEPGADVMIDGQSRGEFPMSAPLRAAAGSHLIRVYKEGFEPFGTRVDLAGGQTSRVNARLRALTATGSLRIVEQSGQAVEVVVDGSAVGKAPWEGRLAVGLHVVLLRGAGNLGTPPVSLSIKRDQMLKLALSAEELGAWVRVEPVPLDASVAIDAITIGRGVWEGRLHAGTHNVEVAAEGFLAAKRQVLLDRGQRVTVSVDLERDPSSPFWPKSRRQGRYLLELGTAVPLVPSFGGDIAAGCVDSCRLNLGVGSAGVVRYGYELGSGLSGGVAIGYLTATQTVTRRTTSVQPVGRDPNKGSANDRLHLQGIAVGAWAGWSFFERFPIHLRLGTGILPGRFSDVRTGHFTSSDGEGYDVGPVIETHSTSFFYVAPEVRIGLPLSRHVEVSVGIEVPVFFSPSPSKWGASLLDRSEEDHAINAGNDGYGMFAHEALFGRSILVIAAGLGARYDI